MSSSELPTLSNKAHCIARIKRALKLSILISEKNPLSLQFYENLTTIRKLRLRQIQSGVNIIHCFSDFSVRYEMWMGTVFTICLVHFPLHAAFGGGESPTMHWFKLLMDCACLVDIVLRFRTAFVDTKEKRIITDPREISLNYLRTLFVPDVISTIPDPCIFVPSSTSPALHIMKLLCLFKLFRIKTAYDYMTRSALVLPLLMIRHKTCLIALFFLLFCHWAACAVYLTSNFRLMMSGQVHVRSWTVDDEHEWTLTRRYIHSLYRASAHILAVKQSSLDKLTLEEKLLACLLYVLGKIIIFYFTVVAVGRFLSAWSLESKYYEVVQELEGFMTRKHLTTATRTRLLQYYSYKFPRTYFEENAIKSILSESLRHQINQNILQKFIAKVAIFEDIPQESMNRIIQHLHLEVFLPHDLIIKAGTSGEFMYFLCSGTVAVYTPSGKEVCHLQDGAYFGEISLLNKDQKRTAHVYAVEICEVFALDRKSFNNHLRPIRPLVAKMSSEASLRMETTKVFEDIHMRNFRV